MAHQDTATGPTRKVPYTERGVSGTRDGGIGIGHLQAPDSGCVAPECMYTCSVRVSATGLPESFMEFIPRSHIPDPNISITASTDQNIAPRDHCPYPHDMPCQSPLMIAFGIEDMYLGVIQGHHNVFLGQM